MQATSYLAVRENTALATQYHNLFATIEPLYDEKSFVSGLDGFRDSWGYFRDRLIRYTVYWALYEGAAYSSIHRWSRALKQVRDLYGPTRAIRSPAKAIGDFRANHVYGGSLDLDAGDGSIVKSAIPIVTSDPILRKIIGQLWRWSNWQIHKNTYALWGGVMGDVFLQCVHDTENRRCYFRLRSAKEVVELRKDDRGNITGYIIAESRPDPEAMQIPGQPAKLATYIEVCQKTETAIQYRSYRNNISDTPYDWNDYDDDIPNEAKTGGEWEQSYGFVPLVHVQNRDVGKDWGWSIYQGSQDKLFEVDDLTSKVNDQIRKIVDAYFFATGVKPEEMDLIDDNINVETREDYIAARDANDHNRKIRNNLGMICVQNVDAAIKAMIAELNIGDVSEYLEKFDSKIAQDFPSLAAEDVSPNSSAETRKIAKEAVEADMVQVRAGYDSPLVVIQKMCITIMIQNQYPLSDGSKLPYPIDAYEKGLLDHSIGDRPVYAVSEDDKIERETKRSIIFGNLIKSGMPFRFACLKAGYTSEETALMVAAKDGEEAASIAADRATQRNNFSVVDTGEAA